MVCPPEKEKRATVRAQGRLRIVWKFRKISLMALLLLSLPLLGSKGKLSPGRRHHSGNIYLYTFSNNTNIPELSSAVLNCYSAK